MKITALLVKGMFIIELEALCMHFCRGRRPSAWPTPPHNPGPLGGDVVWEVAGGWGGA